MSATAGMLSAPAPEVTAALAQVALAAYRERATGRYADLGALTQLIQLAEEPVDGALRRWAERIAAPAGFPLIGTGLSAATYPALLWNGAHLHAAGRSGDAPMLAALAAADPAGDLELVRRAVSAAEAVRQHVEWLLSGPSRPVARPTLATLAAATAAHLAGSGEHGLARVLDLAASLTVLTPGGYPSAVSGLWAGHGAASGWLAAHLPGAAITSMAGSLVHTLSAAAGHPVGDAHQPTFVADLLARLR